MSSASTGGHVEAAGRIRRLSDDVVNKIAAGEVVERPASVVKELVENALDAEATRVSVELRDAGRQLVRVADDGVGMTAAELHLALTRHATSKIRSEEDLDAIATLGFRGEALPAICAVSRFSLRSRARGAEMAALVRGEGGVVVEAVEEPASPGTTVEIQDLFFNTPARLKFLKHHRTELAVILRALQSTALAHPGVHVQVVHDGRAALTAPRVATLRERAGALWGFELAGQLLDVRREERGLAVRGLVGPPQAARGHRDDIVLLVNGRPVRDGQLQQAVLDAYRPLLPRDRYPLAVLCLDLPPQEVDVNVHPSKAWVRFRAPRLVQELLYHAVQEALRSPAVVQPHSVQSQAAPPTAPGDPELAVGDPVAPGAGWLTGAEPSPRLFREPAPPPSGVAFGEVVGQLHETFIVAADERELFFVDQHVAHERVLFERLTAGLEAGPLPGQELLVPAPLELTAAQRAQLEEYTEALARVGFVLEGFGGATVLVRAVPALLGGRDVNRLVDRLLDEVGAPARDAAASLVERTLSFVACRAAIKAPAPLEREEMRRLLRDLEATRTPFFCPHGRPIVSRLPVRDIRQELRRTW